MVHEICLAASQSTLCCCAVQVEDISLSLPQGSVFFKVDGARVEHALLTFGSKITDPMWYTENTDGGPLSLDASEAIQNEAEYQDISMQCG